MSTGSSSILVAVRCRPFNERERRRGSKCIITVDGPKTFASAPGGPKKSPKPPKSGVPPLPPTPPTPTGSGVREFCFDRSYWSFDPADGHFASQEYIFNDLGEVLLQNTFGGYNGCLFAYGQTGSGKTYTMMGYDEDEGMVPRLCRELIQRAEVKKVEGVAGAPWTYKVEVSFLEIYNERVRDLLTPKSAEVKVREHPITGPYVEGAVQLLVGTYDEIRRILDQGNKARTVAATNMNQTSSRSHSIFTLVVTMITGEGPVEATMVSKLNLVDLAGSERMEKAGTQGEALREGCNINRSLSTLGKVISTLASSTPGKVRGHIPYRESALTWLLKENLGGNSKTVMMATVSPDADNYDETMSTLRYAERAKKVVQQAVVNEDPKSRQIRELKEEIETLKDELAKGGLPADLQAALEQAEQLFAGLQMSWEDKARVTTLIQRERTQALEQLGIVTRVDKQLPRIVNLNEDPFMDAALVYYLKPGDTTFGRGGPGVVQDFILEGVSLQPAHCTFNYDPDAAATQGTPSPPPDGALVTPPSSPPPGDEGETAEVAAAPAVASSTPTDETGATTVESKEGEPTAEEGSTEKESASSTETPTDGSESVVEGVGGGGGGGSGAGGTATEIEEGVSVSSTVSDGDRPVVVVHHETGVTIVAAPEAEVRVNGQRVGEDVVRLREGDRIVLGQNHMFRFSHPVVSRKHRPAVDWHSAVDELAQQRAQELADQMLSDRSAQIEALLEERHNQLQSDMEQGVERRAEELVTVKLEQHVRQLEERVQWELCLAKVQSAETEARRRVEQEEDAERSVGTQIVLKAERTQFKRERRETLLQSINLHWDTLVGTEDSERRSIEQGEAEERLALATRCTQNAARERSGHLQRWSLAHQELNDRTNNSLEEQEERSGFQREWDQLQQMAQQDDLLLRARAASEARHAAEERAHQLEVKLQSFNVPPLRIPTNTGADTNLPHLNRAPTPREYMTPRSARRLGPQAPPWKPDHSVSNCEACDKEFGTFVRRHHCRMCGRLFCSHCSASRMPIPEYGYNKPVRVCNPCLRCTAEIEEVGTPSPFAPHD